MTNRIHACSIDIFYILFTPATVLARRLLVQGRLRHMQVLVEVADLGSVKRAAEAVGLTQPTVTHTLADLERLLECRLFERHARGMRPTAQAQAVLPLARRMLDSAQECAHTVAALHAGATQVVRVAAITGAVNGLLAQALPGFSRRHPAILVQVREGEIDQIAQWMTEGVVDLALCREPAVPPQGWAFEALLDDEFVVVCGTRHPLARRRRLGVDELWHETWLLAPVASAPRRAFDALVARAGSTPPLRLVSSRSAQLLWSMLDQQDVIALLPLSFARQLIEMGRIARLHLREPLPFEPLGMLTPGNGLGPAAALFAQFVRRAGRSPG